MSPVIPSGIIEDIKNRLDIVEIVAEHVELKRTGKNYLGLCPFHSEKTPSFTVSQEKQIFHCFGCGEGGDLISFHMAINNASFTEALEELAGQSGIELPSYEKPGDDGRSELIKANEMAMMAYHRILIESNEGKKALEYLHSRKITLDCVKEFLLGFAPARWEGLVKTGSKSGIEGAALTEAGLVYRDRTGKPSRDLFRNRLIFPIMDPRARVIAFGGRSMDGREPKYLNTPETPVFSKRRNLYGLHLAKGEVRSRRAAIIVEGYMDLLALYQAGYHHTIAPLGTSLTEDQAAILSKMCDTVYLMYDSDMAGRKAAFRGGDLLLGTGVVPKFVALPAGEDPASFIAREGAAATQKLFDEAKDVIETKIEILRNRGNLKSIDGKRKAVGYLVDSLCGIRDELMRRLYLEKCSSEMNIPIEVLSKEVAERQRPRRRGSRASDPRGSDTRKQPEKKLHDLTEKYLLLLLLTDSCDSKSFLATVSELKEDDFLDDSYRQIFKVLQELAGNKGNVLELALSRLPQELHSTISSIALDEDVVQNPERMLDDCHRKMKARRIKKSMNEISQSLRSVSDPDKKGEADKMAQRFYELTRELSSLFPASDD